MLNTSNSATNSATNSSSETVRLVQDWADGMTPTVASDRLVRIGFRLTKAAKDRGEVEKTAKAVSVPAVDWKQEFSKFADYLAGCLEKLQEDTIRAAIESGFSTLDESDYGVHGMLALLEAREAEGRLSKDAILQWYNSEVAPTALVQVVAKLGWNVDSLSEKQEQKVMQVLKGLGDMIAALAGSRVQYSDEQKAKLRVYINMGEGRMKERLLARLDKKEELKEEDLFDAL